MRFPTKKNAGCPKVPRDFLPRKDGIIPPTPAGLLWDSLLPSPESVRTYGRTDADVRTNISRIDRLPDLITDGAPLCGQGRNGAPLLMLQ